MNTPNTIYTGSHFASEWRGHSFFAEMDEAQIDAGIELTLDLCRRHDIDPVFYYPSTTFDFPRCFRVATIVWHSNCRADKADLFLPDWVFQKIVAAGIQLRSYMLRHLDVNPRRCSPLSISMTYRQATTSWNRPFLLRCKPEDERRKYPCRTHK